MARTTDGSAAAEHDSRPHDEGGHAGGRREMFQRAAERERFRSNSKDLIVSCV